MANIILYHGSPNRAVKPTFGLGEDRHDYGRGFYLTEDFALAQEWAVCRPTGKAGWVHEFVLETDGLSIVDFRDYDVLAWLAELMKHRDASDSRRYRMLAPRFIEKYSIDTTSCDVIKGWRADASYFYIAREFVRDNVDVDILEDLLSLGDLSIQYCVKSELAYSQLRPSGRQPTPVAYEEFNGRYNDRDARARQAMRDLIDSDANQVLHVFSTLMGE